MIRQGDIWWAETGDPAGSAPGSRRPVVVIQGEAFNRSRIGTVVCVALTSNMKWSQAPGNVRLHASETGLPKDSVANISQILTLDKAMLGEHAGALADARLRLVLAGVDIVLGH